MTKLIIFVLPFVDIFLVPLGFLAALALKPYTRVQSLLPLTRSAFDLWGVSAIRHHYYEPVVLPKDITRNLKEPRNLDFIDFRVPEQIKLLNEFRYQDEIRKMPEIDVNGIPFARDSRNFGVGDFEIYYSLVRHLKPKKIIEIGSGHSTITAKIAALQNENEGHATTITAIEPFEQPWLERLDVEVIRKKVEEAGVEPFQALDDGDFLFIDSSHVIRPQGDVLFNFFSILPILKPGVLVHVHDIFMPSDYPEDWVLRQRRLWNEQYLLEAFLAYNQSFEVVLAANYLKNAHYDELKAVCPFLSPGGEPGSFWMRRSLGESTRETHA